jgi:DNA-binding response OmpR family regulator
MSAILLVEDERHLAEGLAFNLRNSGYDVQICGTGEEALAAIDQQPFDAILLDLMLPGINGLEVARQLRKGGHTQPILMVSARNRTEDAIAGIDAGADDYITKPFDLEEVLARIRGALRRQVWGRSQAPAPAPQSLTYGQWTIDFQAFVARKPKGRELRLSPKEIAILKFFAEHPDEMVSRETFLEEVWGLPGTLETRTVDNFIRKLRYALEDDPAQPQHIVSIRGAGYRFVP